MAEMPKIELWRAGIVALADWAAGGLVGRSKIDPVYVEVTENEHGCERARYSSCADLVHWLAMRLRVEQPWVNRTDDAWGQPWQFAVNVSRIATVSELVRPDTTLEPGDCCISWNRPDTQDAHVWVYLGMNPNVPGEALSANYGAGGMSAAIVPGSRVASKILKRDAQGLIYGTRRVQRVLTVPRLVGMRSGKPCDFSGPAWSASFTGEVRDALEAAS